MGSDPLIGGDSGQPRAVASGDPCWRLAAREIGLVGAWSSLWAQQRRPDMPQERCEPPGEWREGTSPLPC